MECREEYIARVDRVLSYIDANLGGDLGLATLARIADFSPYHFHRVFQAMVGETVHAYAKRMRLKSDAVRLRHARRHDVTRVALDLGFESPSDFARSFKAAYGLSPTAFARSRTGLLDRPLKVAANGNGSEQTPPERHAVVVRTLPDCAIAYVRCVGLSASLESRDIERAFTRLFAWAAARDLVSPATKVVGITLDSPEAVPLARSRYNACITVPDGTEPAAGVLVGRPRSAGKYACMTFERGGRGDAAGFFAGIEFLYRCWLPTSGYLPADKPFIELYHEEQQGNAPAGAVAGGHGRVLVDFCVPLAPL